MKLELIGHDEKYAVEQSLLTLFPDERPVYGPVTDEDASAARITLTEDADSVCVTTELRCGGKAAAEGAGWACIKQPAVGEADGRLLDAEMQILFSDGKREHRTHIQSRTAL